MGFAGCRYFTNQFVELESSLFRQGPFVRACQPTSHCMEGNPDGKQRMSLLKRLRGIVCRGTSRRDGGIRPAKRKGIGIVGDEAFLLKPRISEKGSCFLACRIR
jgi:hypothetical protein